MARKTKVVTIDKPGRDIGKQFLLTEMPADQAERWAMRALLALANAGARMPEGAVDSGMAGFEASWSALLVQGIKSLAGLRWEDAAPLVDELMACVVYQASSTVSMPIMAGGASQIEEVTTRLHLRYEVLQLHVDFSVADALLGSKAAPPSPEPQASA